MYLEGNIVYAVCEHCNLPFLFDTDHTRGRAVYCPYCSCRLNKDVVSKMTANVITLRPM